MALDNVLLIHGAWQGSWVWKSFTPLMTAAGLTPIAVDLPGNGADETPLAQVNLDLYIDCLGQIIASQDSGVSGTYSLVAHSGAGVIATELAERFPDRISRIAYIAGMMLPPRTTFSDLLSQMDAEKNDLQGIETELVWSEDGAVSNVPPKSGAAIFLNDMDPDEAYKAALNLTPQSTSGLAIASDWTPERFGIIPRLYIECTKDLSVKLPVQRAMQTLVPGAKVATIDTGHAPQSSAPKKLAKVLIPFLSEKL